MSCENDRYREGRLVTYCLVPRDLADELYEVLCQHFRDNPSLEVIVERRTRERRLGPGENKSKRKGAVSPTRTSPSSRPAKAKTTSASDRRAEERRVSLLPTAPHDLPSRVRAHADRISFVKRVEPRGEKDEDRDSAQLVVRFQRGDKRAFDALYLRYFDRVYAYARVALNDHHDAEDAAQEAFTRVFAALPEYRPRGKPFRAWLFVILRNLVVDRLRERSRLVVEDPSVVYERLERQTPVELDPASSWVMDSDVSQHVSQLPLDQRRALVLRHLLGLTPAEIAPLLDRSPQAVRDLEYRAIRTLRAKLKGLRDDAGRRGRELEVITRMRSAPVLLERRYALLGSSQWLATRSTEGRYGRSRW